MYYSQPSYIFFFFNDTATTEIYTLSLHDALPICLTRLEREKLIQEYEETIKKIAYLKSVLASEALVRQRSEEHTSELQSQSNLVCRLLLEKKNSRASRSPSCARSTWRRSTVATSS